MQKEHVSAKKTSQWTYFEQHTNPVWLLFNFKKFDRQALCVFSIPTYPLPPPPLYTAHTWLFFTIRICSNVFRDFSGCRCSILTSEMVIRFVCPLAFQCRIRNCSTAKAREDIAKRKRKVENDGSAFLHFFYLFKCISRFLRL